MTHRLDLSGRWTLEDETGEHAIEMALPGDAISALHAAGRIPEPYWGRNEYELRWIAERDWTARRTVTLDRTDLVLCLSDLDCVASVRWNGTEVLSARNAFRSYRVEIGHVAHEGENEVEILFRSNVREAAKAQADQPFYIPYHSGNSPIPHGNMLRKVQCDFGWDWNIALAPFGLYGEIALEPAARPRIGAVHIRQEHTGGTVRLHVTADLEHATDTPLTCEVARPGGRAIRGEVAREGGRATATLTIEDPELWWPAGQGAQPLYTLTLTLGDHTETRTLGLRTVELLTDPDAAGARFAFAVNGREVFMKGANWIPADALAGRIDREQVRGLLQSAVDANMNMIRVWGGGRYEPDWFYDLCDEMGLMVWQDFMFSCNLYPSTPDFLSEVRAEVRENVARLHHRACLALWCGDNELVGALTWFPESVADRDRYLVNYDRLNRCIEDELKATDPGALWWPSSPCPGPMNFGDSWHEDGSGDMHFWSVWHENREFEHYRDVSPRFCSEFGFQSYPRMDTIARFADPVDWNIAAPVFESHQKNEGGNARIASTMFRTFRWPERFEDFVWLSQLQQGLAIKTAVEHWRSLKPHCMGTLYWQLNDTWPVCSWSSIDHGGAWKLLHHMARDFYAPVHVVVRPDGARLEIVGISDLPDPAEVSVDVYAVTPDGEGRSLTSGAATLGTEAEVLCEIPASELAEQEMIALVWTGPEGHSGGDVIAPRPWKTYDLLPPGLELRAEREGDAWALHIEATEAPAFFVTAEADVPGHVSDAAFHLFPGHAARVTFTPDDPAAEPQFTLRDLHSATVAKH
ncbi:beta-mannosidase [Histidinibacterium aquaticum]|uniref:beta-mannosidase n=1 Tax=Histidinibacterium aquaticum TaxID=2613962 RepID=A0A5J5GEE2_9RHOB|nr:glycoside hydrolase family 2 protein [Histidinibacterium aquaticum]KAA9006123.1 glycoside hydrolase family 2 protein [Histidinibacterium aquaticum]